MAQISAKGRLQMVSENGTGVSVLWGFSGVLVTETTPSFGALYDGIIGVGVTAVFAIVIVATPGQ